MSMFRSLGRNISVKSPCEEYRSWLREMVQESGETQAKVAECAGMDQANLNHLLAGRKLPLLDPEKNRQLAVACGRPWMAKHLQLAAEACHDIRKMHKDLRRYMAVAVRVLEQLAEDAETQFVAAQELYKKGKVPVDAIYVPESLLAMKYVTQSLRYWWPAEEEGRWDDYHEMADVFLQRISHLPPEEQAREIVQAYIEEALEWVRDCGDLDPEVEVSELISRLAGRLGVDREALKMAVEAVARAARSHWRSALAPSAPKTITFRPGS